LGKEREKRKREGPVELSFREGRKKKSLAGKKGAGPRGKPEGKIEVCLVKTGGTGKGGEEGKPFSPHNNVAQAGWRRGGERKKKKGGKKEIVLMPPKGEKPNNLFPSSEKKKKKTLG